MLSSDSQHKIHRLVPRRKVKSGSLADISLKKSGGAAVETSSAYAKNGTARLSGPVAAASTTAASLSATSHKSTMSRPLEVTPDKSPKPQHDENQLSSSSSDESIDERTALISEIDLSKLSPGINPHTMSNYELLRLRNIQRNEAKLASLGLVGLTTKKTSKKTSKKTKKKAPPPPAASNAALVAKRTAKNSPYVFQHTVWHTRYAELSSYVIQGPNGKKTLSDFSMNKPLKGWIQRQKAQYQKYKRGEKSSLNDDKVEMLLEVADEEFWMGARLRPVVRREKVWSAEDESIGSEDSYSVEADYDEFVRETSPKKKTAVQRELEGLRSPEWMDRYSDDDNFAVGEIGVAKKAATRRDLNHLRKAKQTKHGKINDSKYPASKIKATSKRSITQKRNVLDGSESDHNEPEQFTKKRSSSKQKRRDYFDESSSLECSDGDSRPKSARGRSKSKPGKSHGRESSFDYSDEDSHGDKRRRRASSIRDKTFKRRHRSQGDYSDDESLCIKRRRSSRSSRRHERRRLSRDYSDDESLIDSRRMRRDSSSKRDSKNLRKHKRQQTPPKRAAARSSLELLGAPSEKATTQQLGQQPSKRKGVVSEESERPAKRARKESIRKMHYRDHYSESSECSDIMSTTTSYSSTSNSTASTKSTSSSSLYASNRPMNEVVITQQTNLLTTHNNPNDELRKLMAEHRQLMLEYRYVYSSNLEKMNSMRTSLHDMRGIEAKLIQNGSALINRVDGTSQLMLEAEQSCALILGEALMPPHELDSRPHNVGLIDAWRPRQLSTTLDQHNNMIVCPPATRGGMKELEWPL